MSNVSDTVVDLARWGGLTQGVCAMDHALRYRLCTREELTAALDRLPAGARGLRVARTAVRLADPSSESPGESLSRVRMWQAGIPRPVLQYEVRTEVGLARTDYFWPESIVQPHPVSEFDGEAKYHRETYGRATEETASRSIGASGRCGVWATRWRGGRGAMPGTTTAPGCSPNSPSSAFGPAPPGGSPPASSPSRLTLWAEVDDGVVDLVRECRSRCREGDPDRLRTGRRARPGRRRGPARSGCRRRGRG